MPANPFPIPAPPFDGRSRAVGVGAVFVWLRLGWNLFMLNPGLWIASAAVLIVGFLALMIVPLVGQLLACLLTPVLIAGLFAMCRKAAGEGTFGWSDLTVGFTTQTAPLMMLGPGLFAAIVLSGRAGGPPARGLFPMPAAVRLYNEFGGAVVLPHDMHITQLADEKHYEAIPGLDNEAGLVVGGEQSPRRALAD